MFENFSSQFSEGALNNRAFSPPDSDDSRLLACRRLQEKSRFFGDGGGFDGFAVLFMVNGWMDTLLNLKMTFEGSCETFNDFLLCPRKTR